MNTEDSQPETQPIYIDVAVPGGTLQVPEGITPDALKKAVTNYRQTPQFASV